MLAVFAKQGRAVGHLAVLGFDLPPQSVDPADHFLTLECCGLLAIPLLQQALDGRQAPRPGFDFKARVEIVWYVQGAAHLGTAHPFHDIIRPLLGPMQPAVLPSVSSLSPVALLALMLKQR